MSSLAEERMSRVDTAWLRMDNDVNLMMIVGVWLLKPRVTLEAVRQRYADKLLKYDRFRQKVVSDTMGTMWVEDEDFDIARHVSALRLERRRGQSEHAALQALCGRLATTPLDPNRPLWQFDVIEDFDGGSAIVARIHHCIADGIALISVMMSLTDGGGDPPRRRRRPSQAEAQDDWLADAVLKPGANLASLKCLKCNWCACTRHATHLD